MKTTDHVTDHVTDHGCCDVYLIEQLKSVPLESSDWIKDEKSLGVQTIPYGRYCQEAAEALQKAEAEVERLKELLNRAINEIEKTPFNTPKLTAFTAHRLAERYRADMTNTSTKPIESQEDDK